MTVEILAAEATNLFIGSDDAPRQVVRVALRGTAGTVPGSAEAARVTVEVRGSSRANRSPWARSARAKAAQLEVGVAVAEGAAPGEILEAEVVVAGGGGDARHPFEIVVAEPGWRMFMIPHFHYDPVWWNTQAAYTETWGAASNTGRRSRSPAWRSSRRTSRWRVATPTTSSCSPSSTTSSPTGTHIPRIASTCASSSAAAGSSSSAGHTTSRTRT